MCGSVWRVCTGVVWRVYVCRCVVMYGGCMYAGVW